MGSLIGVSLSVPIWYFSVLLSPFSEPFLTLPIFLGILCLFAGSILGFIKKRKCLRLFLYPFFVSQLFAAFSGFALGELKDSTTLLHAISLGFIFIQIVLTIFIIRKCGKPYLPSALLTIFTITYTLFTLLVAGMAFSNTWL